jgi:hypothetical protein
MVVVERPVHPKALVSAMQMLEVPSIIKVKSLASIGNLESLI